MRHRDADGLGGDMEIVAAYRGIRAAIEAAANMTPPASVYDKDQILHPELGDRGTVAADHRESLRY
jgi:hypothetical protein